MNSGEAKKPEVEIEAPTTDSPVSHAVEKLPKKNERREKLILAGKRLARDRALIKTLSEMGASPTVH